MFSSRADCASLHNSIILIESFPLSITCSLVCCPPTTSWLDSSLPFPSAGLLQGFLFKSGSAALARMKERYFILFKDKLLFFRDKSMQATKGHSKGVIPLDGDFVVEEKDSQYNSKHMNLYNFFLHMGGDKATRRKYKLACKTKEQKDKWVKALKRSVAQRMDPANAAQEAFNNNGSANSANSISKSQSSKRMSAFPRASVIQGLASGDKNSPTKKRRSGTVPSNMVKYDHNWFCLSPNLTIGDSRCFLLSRAPSSANPFARASCPNGVAPLASGRRDISSCLRARCSTTRPEKT